MHLPLLQKKNGVKFFKPKWLGQTGQDTASTQAA